MFRQSFHTLGIPGKELNSEVDIMDYPNQLYVVLTLQQSKTGDMQSRQSGAVTLETTDVTAYLPIYTNYQDALREYPNFPIYVMSSLEFKNKPRLPI
jgi:hypothetical protein